MEKQINLLTMHLKHVLYCGNNMEYLPQMDNESIELAILDPPYNTGAQRVKYNGNYNDKFTSSKSYILWLKTVVEECHRILTDNGSMFLFINQHEEYNVWTMLRSVFGEDNLINKIVWMYDWGHRERKRWTPKHDTIFWFAKDKDNYIFNRDESDRIAKRAPGLFNGSDTKLPTDCWWNTIVTASSGEATGYPTQKPLKIIERIVRVHSNLDNTILDPFAGSGTTGVAAEKLARNSILIDENEQAIEVVKNRMNYDNFYVRRSYVSHTSSSTFAESSVERPSI